MNGINVFFFYVLKSFRHVLAIIKILKEQTWKMHLEMSFCSGFGVFNIFYKSMYYQLWWISINRYKININLVCSLYLRNSLKYLIFSENNMDGLQHVKEWILRHANKLQYTEGHEGSEPIAPPPTPAAVLNTAFLELLDWDTKYPYPEVTATVEPLYKDHPRWWPFKRGGLSRGVK